MTDVVGTSVRPLVVGLGEVLWDLLPEEKSLGGAPANCAFHAAQLGAEAAVASAVGRDALGDEVRQLFATLGLATTWLQTTDAYPTGTVSVEVDQGQPSYTIHTGVAWDHLSFNVQWAELAARADAVCFGSLAQRTDDSEQVIQQFLQATRRDCLRVFDINLRQQFYDLPIIDCSLAVADVLKLNNDELPRVAQLLQFPTDEATSIERLFARYPLRVIALTRGDQGSTLFTRFRTSHHPVVPVKIADTVGAGDSFTAALIMGLLRQDDLDQLHHQAAQLAAFVCSHHGAMPRHPRSLSLDGDVSRANGNVE